nr:DUF3768 domain-containing protein [Mesorhizobium sp. L2C054A000]
MWAEVIRAVSAFEAFDQDNDPHGEHDCAVVDIGGLTIIWKIDYFDQTLLQPSADPANSQVTRRVMTIMLAEEY